MRKRRLSYIPCLLLSALLLAAASPHALAADNNPADTIVDEVVSGDTMASNSGTVTLNSGTITNNYGTIGNNAGIVTNNFGTITAGNAANNQYYPVTCTGAEHVAVSGGTVHNGAYYACAADALVFTANPGYKIDSIGTTATKNADWNYNITTAESADFALSVSRTTQSITAVAALPFPMPTQDVYARIMASSGGGAAAPVTADATGADIGDANGVFALRSAENYEKTFTLFTHTADSTAITYTMQEGVLSSGLFTPVAEGCAIKIDNKNYAVSYTGTTATNSPCTVVTLDQDGGTGGTESFCPVNNMTCPSITPPTKDGYVFQGYYSDDADEIQVFYAGGAPVIDATSHIDENANWVYNTTSEVTLKAHWAELAATVTTSGGVTTQYTTFIEAWARAKTSPDSTLMLFKDVTASNTAPSNWPLSVPRTSVFALDLNGQTIDRGQTTPINDGGVIEVEGDFTLTDTRGGGVITGGNTTGNGGGVFISSEADVSILGGSITGNKAGGHGGGMYISSLSTGGGLSLGGAATVTGNTGADGKASNVYISAGERLMLTSPALTGSIGVTAGDLLPATISTATAADYSSHFSADVPEQNVFTEAGVLKLRAAPTTAVTLDVQSGTGGSASCTAVFGRALGEIASYPAPTLPTRDNYTFEGYYSAATGGVQVINEEGTLVSSVTGYTDANAHWASDAQTLTLFAHWTPVEYTITYKDKGDVAFSGTHGTNAPEKHIYDTATTLVAPTKTGYTFGGWYTAADCSGTALTVLTAEGYSADITLYAKWNARVFAINYFDKNSATFSGTHGDEHPVSHTYGKITNLVSPSKTGYDFGGWFTAADCSGTALTALPADGYLEAIDLYANWTESVYTITYKDHGGTDFTGTHGANAPTQHTYNTATALVAPTKTGYTFGGWYALADCSGTALTTLGATDYSEEIRLYAKWTANVYDISYYNSGGVTFNGKHAANYPKTHTYGQITKLDSPKRDKYTFGGWYTASDCSGTAVTNLLATAYTDDIKLYAKWTFSYVPGYSTGVSTAKKYIITYKDQDDKDFTGVLPATAPRSYVTGKAILLPKAIRSGFTFDGWFTDKACSGKAITSIAAIGYNADITVYARWLEESYLLSYRDRGGSAFTGILPDGAPTEHGYSENTKLLPPTREGYIFSGWYENMDCTGEPITELEAESRTTDVLLYAKWTALDAGLTGVRVNGENARLAGSTLTVTLPEGSTLPTEASAIEILAEGAAYTEPVTDDNGATWTFSVTSPNGEKKDYTLKVSVREPAQGLTEPDEEKEKSGLPLWPFLLGAGVLAAGGGLWYYFYRRKQYEY